MTSVLLSGWEWGVWVNVVAVDGEMMRCIWASKHGDNTLSPCAVAGDELVRYGRKPSMLQDSKMGCMTYGIGRQDKVENVQYEKNTVNILSAEHYSHVPSWKMHIKYSVPVGIEEGCEPSWGLT